MAETYRTGKTEILDHHSEWGLTVSERSARKGFGKRIMVIGAYALFGAAAILAMPLIAGALFFPNSDGMLLEFSVVAIILFGAMAIKFKADDTQRNAVQVDYRAAELRLGYEKKDGTFIRNRVFSFREIDSVEVQKDDEGQPQLCLVTDGNYVSISFNGSSETEVRGLAGQIAAARESALRAPIRSRVQSKIHGLEASFNEVKSRVRSTIAHA